ncbi:uncharacterized protein BX664DRAFT_381348 [Halteromyces radiatus]|uniref:uncharacterized protein n=1 Tax=Halteromyces radiatus TaxID=101107 RepID=UPI00221EDFEC|nr:uncharacterized protein BX664DRAFT_381348 [Halteromyces radiatus]KAI8098663.1 hypothetical protein BX664DRAFT_381348 [Halteromyces radiatus]
MSKPTTLLQRLSLAYKLNRFPWKKNVLVGTDLDGNEYWEMPSPLGGRYKRWVQMKEHDDYAVFNQNQLPVQWQAWLRHTRTEAPSLQELVQEQRRRLIIQERAKKLDEEWQQRKLQLKAEQEEAARIEESRQQSESSNSTEPTGQGDTFVPGEWTPTNVRR